MREGVFDTRRHSNVKSKPAYRLVNVNYKSIEKAKQEKQRRRRVFELWIGDLTIKKIAAKLGVSERTVDRDLAWMRSSVNRAFARRFGLLAEEERLQLLSELNGLSRDEQIKRMSEKLAVMQKIARVKRCSKLLVTLDADAALAGRAALKLKPSPPVCLISPAVLNLRVIVKGEIRYAEQIALG